MRIVSRDDKDFAQIARLNRLCFLEDEQAPEGLLREQWEHGDFFSIQQEGVIASWAILSVREGEPYIWAIATDIRFRRQGLASVILDEIEAWARENHSRFIGLTTHRDNPAQKLYFDKGYRVTRVVKDYYLSGDGIYMRRKLL